MAFETTVAAIRAARTWDERVQQIRRIPELHGTAEHAAVCSSVAEELYVPDLSPQFAFIPWREDYELQPFVHAYKDASKLTKGSTDDRYLYEEDISTPTTFPRSSSGMTTTPSAKS